jgi:hypothetical protein
MSSIGFPDILWAFAWGIKDFWNHSLHRKSSVQPFSDKQMLIFLSIELNKQKNEIPKFPHINIEPFLTKFLSREDEPGKKGCAIGAHAFNNCDEFEICAVSVILWVAITRNKVSVR